MQQMILKLSILVVFSIYTPWNRFSLAKLKSSHFQGQIDVWVVRRGQEALSCLGVLFLNNINVLFDTLTIS